MSATSLKNAILSSMRKGAFGSTQRRLKLKSEDVENVSKPPPNLYQMPQKTTETGKLYKVIQQSSAFVSKTKRMDSLVDSKKVNI